MDINFNLNLFVGSADDEEEFDMISHDDSLSESDLFEQDKLLCLDAFSGTTPSNYNTNERRKRNTRNQRNYRERRRLFTLGERRDAAGDKVLIWLIPKNSNHIKGYASPVLKPACQPDMKKIRQLSFDYITNRETKKNSSASAGSRFTITYEPKTVETIPLQPGSNRPINMSTYVPPPPKPLIKQESMPNINLYQNNVFPSINIGKPPKLGVDIEMSLSNPMSNKQSPSTIRRHRKKKRRLVKIEEFD